MKVVPFKAGMYLLETLTSGMYNDPLSIYREYIQNSVDSIDHSDRSIDDTVIKITLNPLNKSVTIYDNGDGIAAGSAEKILSSIGSSEKLGTTQRGFRGIGRFGGIAFARKVIFTTTTIGESTVSRQEWDCEELRKYLNSPDHTMMTIEELFSKVSSFSQSTDEELRDISFFEVQLLDVESFRNYILDIQRIKNYLIQVAPLPFDPEKFSFYDQVHSFLSDNLPQYGEYRITLNDEQLFRPYKDELEITSKQKKDRLDSVKLFSLNVGKEAIAYGWYGNRRDFLGAIKKGAVVSGLRVKVGNLQVGDQHLLDRCFRENRFNSYIVGEIHVCNQSLKPNSRRDDFVDNIEKTQLYNLIERDLGLPLSKKIRLRSRIQTEKKPSLKEPYLMKTSTLNKTVIQNSTFSDVSVEDENPARPQKIYKNIILTLTPDIVEQLLNKCGDCQILQEVLLEQLK